MSDYIDQFRHAIEAAGLPAPDHIIDDGALHRFGTSGKPGDDSGWYVLHTDGVSAGTFGCWRIGFQSSWCAKSTNVLTEIERTAMRNRMQAMDTLRKAEKERLQGQAKDAAASLLAKSAPAVQHAYLKAKGIQANGARIDGDCLIIPMHDTAGAIHSLQKITPDGEKRFQYGGRVRGCYFGIGKPDGRLIICEGFATGASIHECTGYAVAVAFNAGNLESVALALRQKYSSHVITIAADDDIKTEGNPGLTKATAAALAVGGSLAVPVFPADRPDKATDFNDLHKLAGADAVRQCIDAAYMNVESWPVPESLFASYDAIPYPIDALPQTIREAVQEVIGFVKAPIALAASSALSSVSVALQGLYDVERAPGLKSPISLYLLSIAESGERKTTCDGFFKQALEQWQREQAEIMKPDLEAYKADLQSWEAEKSGILEAIKKASKENKPSDNHKSALRKLEQEKPIPVRLPRLIRGDDTPENLGWALMREWPSAGVLSSEAGVVFGSHGMSGDSVTRNLALLNVLWDGGSNPIGRRTSESYTIEKVRLTMGLQVQESTLRTFFDRSKGLARGTGFLARFLLAWPVSTMGTRHYLNAQVSLKLAIFNHRIMALLSTPISIEDDGTINTVTLSLSNDAHAVWVKFHNAIETQLAPDGDFVDVKDVASKVADNAARLAALFHVFENGAGAVSADAMARGAKLAAWHLSEAQRFLGQFAMPVEWMNAIRLESWLIQYFRREGGNVVSTKKAMQFSPLRDKATLEAAMAHLGEHERAKIRSEGKKRMIVINPALLEVSP